MAVYLDSSALVKLVVAEAESGALRRFLRRHPERVSSALVNVEVVRAVRSQGNAARARARLVLARVRLLAVDDALLLAAAALDPGILRSLDAIHLASAQAIGDDLDWVLTYDRRMSDGADLLGLPWQAPGSSADGRSRPRQRQGRT